MSALQCNVNLDWCFHSQGGDPIEILIIGFPNAPFYSLFLCYTFPVCVLRLKDAINGGALAACVLNVGRDFSAGSFSCAL